MFELAVPEETFHTPPGFHLSSNPSLSSVGGTLVEIIEDPIVIPVENAVVILVMDPSFTLGAEGVLPGRHIVSLL